MMRILVAPNAFKGALSASKAAQAMAKGVRLAAPHAKIDLMPISDGGDGLMEVLLGRYGGRRIQKTVTGPLGRPRPAFYAILRDRKTAVIEMAQASGIAGLKPGDLDPLGATSYGTGELIRDALDNGVSQIIVGMGGSATNDGGVGMAAALGVLFLDAKGRPIPHGAAPLLKLDRIVTRFLDRRIHKVNVIAVSDVTNPLLGPLSSAKVYGPQKGATPAQVRIIDQALARYAAIIRLDLRQDIAHVAGSGAAGGLGAGLLAFLKARIVPGAAWVLSALNAKARLAQADLVLTGEGRLDSPSFYGKAPVELARWARREQVPVAFICGQVESHLAARLEGLDSPEVAVLSSGGDVNKAMKETGKRLRQAAAKVAGDFL